MLHDLLVFTPFMMCILGFVLNAALTFRTRVFPVFQLLLAVATLFFMVDGYYSSIYGTPEIHIWFTLLNQLVAPSFIPLTVLYFKKLVRESSFRPLQFVWVTIPAGMFAATGLLMTIIGTDQLTEFVTIINTQGVSSLTHYKGLPVHSYFVWSTIILRVILGAELLYMIGYAVLTFAKRGYSIRLLRDFLYRDGRVDVLHLQVIPAVVIGIIYVFKVFLFKNYLDNHLGLTAIFSILTTMCVFGMCYFNLFSAKSSVTLKECTSVMRYNYGNTDRQQVEEDIVSEIVTGADADSMRRIRARVGVTTEVEAWGRGENKDVSLADAIFTAVSKDTDSLMGRFQRLMQEEQLYLKPGLSLDDIAERLDSNKTYVSKMVNTSYNMGFPELLNILRIDYAQHYILLHRDAKQDAIARDCGFFSASSFNTVFKKITGMTPKVWIASYDKSEKRSGA